MPTSTTGPVAMSGSARRFAVIDAFLDPQLPLRADEAGFFLRRIRLLRAAS